jgi:CHAT domain-containing protein/Flp pilus assembly protein TadD
LGNIDVKEGDLEAGERYFLTALQMDQAEAPSSFYVTNVMNSLALVYQSRGDFDLAEDFFREVLERIRKSPSEFQPSYLVSLAGSAQERHDLATARDLYRQALDLAAKMDRDSLALARILTGRGRLAVAEGDLPAAEADYLRAKEILQRVAPASLMHANVLTLLGALYASRGDLAQAEGELRASLALSERWAPKSWQRAKTLHLLALVLRRKGATTQAARELGRALECLEAQVQQLGGSEEAKGEFRAEAGSLYRDAVRQELELHHPGEAFRLLERFRAQAFLSLLAERDLAFSADIPAELDHARRRLTTLYDHNELRLATLDPEKAGEAVAALRREQLRLRGKREELDTEIRRSSPRLSAMIHPQTLDFEQVRAALDPGTVMLSYSVGVEETQLFVVTPGKNLAVKTLPIGENALRKEITQLRQLVEQVQSRSGLGAGGLDWVSRHLYQSLVQPAEPWIAAGARILIVPDGPLHLLPFAALIRGTGEKRSGRGWQYLVEWKPLHTALSGTVYAELKERRRRPGDAPNPAQWVGFGDPWFPPRLAEGKPGETGETRLRSFSTRTGLRWRHLPESRREVERIGALFPEGERKVYVDRDATEERAKALGRDARIVHFATHGFVDDRSPFDSGLVLAIPEQFVEGHDNGLLQVWEIFQSVRLDADLVVLSACETGLGEIRGGEGIIGLTRAFQYAGARSVVASLWRVDDKATADLMELFYRHLRAGSPKDEALRAAQLEMLARPGGSAAAPYFWASMQLFGDWR